MPGRGPAPKPPDQRRRRNITAAPVVVAADGESMALSCRTHSTGPKRRSSGGIPGAGAPRQPCLRARIGHS
jgi:hypothetical protein